MNRNQIKYIAMFSMLFAHVAYLFMPADSPTYFIFQFVGHITPITMSYFLSEGYYYTRNKKYYIIRLACFAIISQVPRYLFINDLSLTYGIFINWSVIYTYLISFLILYVLDNIHNKHFRCSLFILLFILTLFGDWNIIIPLWVISFYHIRTKNLLSDSIFLKITVYTLLSLLPFVLYIGIYPDFDSYYIIGSVVAVPILMSYNNKKGSNHPFHKLTLPPKVEPLLIS